jgi:hypothetical protein
LLQGDRRDFVVIDPGSGLNVLEKRTLDVSAAPRYREGSYGFISRFSPEVESKAADTSRR